MNQTQTDTLKVASATVLLESQEQRRARIMSERQSLIKQTVKGRQAQRKSNYNSILQTGTPTRVLNLCILNEQKELEMYLNKVRQAEGYVTDMDELDQTYSVLVEDVL